MGDDEGGLRLGRVLGAVDAEDGGLQSFDDIELQLGRRRVVHHVPGSEQQLVSAYGELWQAVVE